MDNLRHRQGVRQNGGVIPLSSKKYVKPQLSPKAGFPPFVKIIGKVGQGGGFRQIFEDRGDFRLIPACTPQLKRGLLALNIAVQCLLA